METPGGGGWGPPGVSGHHGTPSLDHSLRSTSALSSGLGGGSLYTYQRLQESA